MPAEEGECPWCYSTGFLEGDPDEIECDCVASIYTDRLQKERLAIVGTRLLAYYKKPHVED